jgi:hypothetical protein
MNITVINDGNAYLTQVVGALRSASRFTGCLDSGNEQGDQNADDPDDYQELDKSECSAAHLATRVLGLAG